jgi:hypothetical protein
MESPFLESVDVVLPSAGDAALHLPLRSESTPATVGV